MSRWFWCMLWVSQVINWIVTIWAYGTVDGSCLVAPLFTDDWEYDDEEDIMEMARERNEDYYNYYELKKGA